MWIAWVVTSSPSVARRGRGSRAAHADPVLGA
jgi:hypothetical protein